MIASLMSSPVAPAFIGRAMGRMRTHVRYRSMLVREHLFYIFRHAIQPLGRMSVNRLKHLKRRMKQRGNQRKAGKRRGIARISNALNLVADGR
jgi:hypothetical protein